MDVTPDRTPQLTAVYPDGTVQITYPNGTSYRRVPRRFDHRLPEMSDSPLLRVRSEREAKLDRRIRARLAAVA